jgi:hypothetical protein
MMGLVVPIEAALMLTIKLLLRVGFRYELDVVAVDPTDPPQSPRLRSFALDFPSRLFVVVHEKTISL